MSDATYDKIIRIRAGSLIRVLFVILLLSFFTSGAAKTTANTHDGNNVTEDWVTDHRGNMEINQEDDYKVGLVLLGGGTSAEDIDDEFTMLINSAINDGKYSNSVNYSKINFEEYDYNATIANLQDLIDTYHYDLLIGNHFVFAEPFPSLAINNTDVKFGGIDFLTTPKLSNIKVVHFKQHEGTFLLGLVAGLASITQRVGFIGSVDTALIQKFRSGFEQGARFVNPDIYTHSVYICPNSGVVNASCNDNPWANKVAGYNIADDMIKNEIDIIFPVAGRSGDGVFDRIAEAHREGQMILGMGTDLPFERTYPNTSIASWVKRWDYAIDVIVGDMVENTWTSGIQEIGIGEGGVDISTLNLHKFEERYGCTEDFNIHDYINYIKQKIASGTFAINAELQEVDEYNSISHSCLEVRDEYYEEETDLLPLYLGLAIVLVLMTVLPVMRYYHQRTLTKLVSFSYNNKIETLISSEFNHHPEIIPYFLNPAIVKDKDVVEQFQEDVPAQLLKYKHLIHPIRLAITKLLFEFGDFTTVELREKLGISWDELNNNLKALKRKKYIFTSKKVIDEKITKVVSLNPDKLSEYREVISLLIDFLTTTPYFDIYVNNVDELTSRKEYSDLYPPK